MNKLPRDIILIISKMHPLIIPPFTNKTLRRAVKDYLAGGARKERIVDKYGEISNWNVSNVTNMDNMFNVPGHGHSLAQAPSTTRSTLLGTFFW